MTEQPNDAREPWLSLVEAAAWVGPRYRGDKPTIPATIRRWIIKGLDGVQLRATCVGNMLMTRASWLEQFFDDVFQARYGEKEPEPKRVTSTPNRRRKEHEQAEAELRRRNAL